jgi:hypothetical protein
MNPDNADPIFDSTRDFAAEAAAVHPELHILCLLQHAARAAVQTLISSNPDTACRPDEAGGDGLEPDAHLGRIIITLANALADAIATYEAYVMHP